jgi:large subunit ribosomal protein L1
MINALKAGRIEFRNDKTGVVHAPVGKASFEADKLTENVTALTQALVAAKPDTVKGIFLRTLYVSSTMGPSVKIAI